LKQLDWPAEITTAQRKRQAGELLRLGGRFEKEGLFQDAWLALTEAAEIIEKSALPVWNGPGSGDRHLLVRRRIRHLGAELRNARFIGRAARDVPHVTVATEERLVSLIQRTFPTVNVVSRTTSVPADSEASYERLAQYYGASAEDIAASFVPLDPPRHVQVPGSIGIAWHSTNSRKLLPALGDWVNIVASIDGPVQSLQYDEEKAGRRELESLCDRPITPSPIDQMTDVDGFAALVASVEGVLTISNTTAHMAGALGIPCVVVLDDLDHLMWPAGDRTPFYPSIRLIRHNGRPSSIVIEEGLAMLRGLMKSVKSELLRAHH
jgi:hypothetical protein